MAGIKCPGYRKGEDGRDTPEPYADEARYFTEARLLNRDVRVALQAVTNNVFLGTVHHPRGNIAELLLREGMAHVVDWSLSVMADGRDQYRAAEANAKQGRLRLFREYVAPNSMVQGDKEYTAKCVEIVNVETIVVKKQDGSLQKLTLASIRQPRQKDGEERSKSYYDIPWMYEAREFLRRKLVGHKVHVAIDYVKPATDGYPEKLCATVTIDGVYVLARCGFPRGVNTHCGVVCMQKCGGGAGQQGLRDDCQVQSWRREEVVAVRRPLHGRAARH